VRDTEAQGPHTFEDVKRSDVYPKIFPRNGPEPGIVVIPAIADGYALLLKAWMMPSPDRDHQTVVGLYLIKGAPPNSVARIIGRPVPQPAPGLRRPKPPTGK
jgi:hypothetical protein